MTSEFGGKFDWGTQFRFANENIGSDKKPSHLWKSSFAWQIAFTELALRDLDMKWDTQPEHIPGINQVQNFRRFDLRQEGGIVEIIGMPGAGKDTSIELLGNQFSKKLVCASEEGYFWEKKEFPLDNLNQRHFRAYGGTDMEIDELVGKLSLLGRDRVRGVGVLNRSIQDNFWAFGYSFFLSGFLSVREFINSQRTFHYFQYSPTILTGKRTVSVEELTVATFIFMIPPEKSLERIPRRGTILNEQFLNILYLQYLRMISRLISMKWPNLVILDMSGSLEESMDLFDQKFKEVFKL